MAELEKRMIYQGTELKFLLDITSMGFNMVDDDFFIVVKNMKGSITIPKEDMVLTEDDKFIFTVNTATLGTGDYYVIVTAQVPDEDFDDGFRQEVQKALLCTVTS